MKEQNDLPLLHLSLSVPPQALQPPRGPVTAEGLQVAEPAVTTPSVRSVNSARPGLATPLAPSPSACLHRSLLKSGKQLQDAQLNLNFR